MKRFICLIFGHKWELNDSEMITHTKTSEYLYHGYKCLRCGEYKGRVVRFIKRDIEKEIVKIVGGKIPFPEFFK